MNICTVDYFIWLGIFVSNKTDLPGTLAGRDRQIVPGKNLSMLEDEFGLDPWTQTGNM